ncbi:ABC transporter substrate-binding protein [Reyranella sp.]|uniref:ABC transporter substrate-binding protein n=1 Tax=Reyranella sp. TaxID=1929291 RepID=UPI003BAC6D02
MLTAALLAGSPVSAQRAGGTLRMFHWDNPLSSSILEEDTPAAVIPFLPVFNGLVMFDPTKPQNTEDSIVPDLAESWSWNEDRTELTFKLRRDVKWHDGWAFTAADVECTFELLTGRARDPLKQNPRGSWFRNINYVHGNTDQDVTIYLNRPQPSLLMLLASGLTPIYPCHVPGSHMRTKAIGTGPFRIESFKQFDSVRLVRNPDYFKPGKPLLDGIEFSIVASPSTALLGFVAGRYDMTFPWDVSIRQLRDVRRQAPRVACETTPMNSSTNILINRDAAPFDDPEIRRALVMALDRRAFITALNEGFGDIGGILQPPPEGLWGLPPDRLAEVPGRDPDVAKNRAEARAIMEKAGYGPARPLQIKILTRSRASLREPAALLAEQLRTIHVAAQLEPVTASRWLGRMHRRDFMLSINVTANGVDDPDQTYFENFSCRSERNYSGYCNGEIERLFDLQSAETDAEKRRQMVWDIDARLLADAARPTIMWNSNATCWQPYVRGFVPSVNSMFNVGHFEDVWLDR